MNRNNNMNFIRTVACILILFMHVKHNYNFNFSINSLDFINNAGRLVPLFFVLSGYSLCSGYYDRIKSNKISIYDFYKKRYIRILPFFALLTFIDIFSTMILDKSISLDILYESFANISLLYGFLSNINISVIGVGWSLGIIFAFYILFPFYCFTIWTKKMAWCSFFLSLIYNYLCSTYFLYNGSVANVSLLRWSCYFYLGGIIYLNKEFITNFFQQKNFLVSVIIGNLLVVCGFYIVLIGINTNSDNTTISLTIAYMLSFSLILIGTMCPENILFVNKFTSLISGISFEIYLSHMLIFRIIEITYIKYQTTFNIIQYLFICILTLVGSIIFINIFKKLERNYVQP